MVVRIVSRVVRDGILRYIRSATSETFGFDANIFVSAWRGPELEAEIGEPPTEPGPEADAWWEEFDTETSQPDSIRPFDRWWTHNISCETLHVDITTMMNPSTPVAGAEARYELAVGEGTGVAPTVQDSALTDPAESVTITNYTSGDRQLTCRGVLSTSQANGLNITEIGVVGHSGLYNHATFGTGIEKTDQVTLTVEVQFTILDSSEVS